MLNSSSLMNSDAKSDIPVLASQTSRITYAERAARNGHHGAVVWMTGLSASGKTTIAHALERGLFDKGYLVCILDGDDLRGGLNRDLSYSPKDRHENIRRIAEVSRLRVELGFIVIVAAISPYRADRARARNSLSGRPFMEVYINAPLELCEERDPKGHYRRARAGLITDFTGISSPYEPPDRPELELSTADLSVDECVRRIIKRLQSIPGLKFRQRNGGGSVSRTR